MLELKNSKTIYLGHSKFAVDCFIGAVQMREPDGEWVDIKPRLVRKPTDDGYYADRVPYYAEFNDDGSRLFCPDKYQGGVFFGLATIPLLANLPKNLVTSPTKLDGEILLNKVVMPASWGEIRIPFVNTAMQFEVLFNEAPPGAIFGQDSSRIVFNTDLAGLDLLKLLYAKTGLGIPRPRLTEVGKSLSEAETRWLDWSYKDGQLELGFDLTGLDFPVLLTNTTIDEQVEAATDSAYEWGDGTFSRTSAYCMVFSDTDDTSSDYRCSGARFQTVDVPNGATIGVASSDIYIPNSGGDSPNMQIHMEDVDDAVDFATNEDVIQRTRTTNFASWVGDNIGTGYQTSADFASAVQEVVNRGGWAANQDMAVLYIAKTDLDRHCYFSSLGSPPKLHIEYEAAGGGGGGKRGWWSK
jgi:hypothetical protein